MSVHKIKNHGKWVWQARVAYQGLRKAAFRASKDEARQAESDLRRELKEKAGQAEQEGQRPATLRQLFEFYVDDLEAGGKGDDTLVRQARTARVIEQGVIMLPRAKAGARPVILSAEAQKVLRGQLEGHESEWVFPSQEGRPYDRSYIGRRFRKAARAAGLRDFHFHDLRHHGATMALNKGFTAPIVMALGGWKTERMMRGYAAVTDQTLRAAAEAVSGTELPLVSSPPGHIVTGLEGSYS